MAHPKLGERIRALRKARDYTLTQFAAMAGVSPSFLSMLETGKTDVSAQRLQAIAAALGLRAGDLLPDGDAQALIHTVRADRRPLAAGFARGVRAQLLTRDLHRRIQPVLLTLGPGAVHANDTGHAGEEFIFVLAGRVRLTVGGDEETTLEPGDSAYYPSALAHRYENVGDDPAELLTISTPPRAV